VEKGKNNKMKGGFLILPGQAEVIFKEEGKISLRNL